MISLASSSTIISPSQTSIDKYDHTSRYYSSSSSSSVNILDDEENITITAFKPLPKRKSNDDLQVLAVSSHLTELQFNISDIQTRIFAIQELRHESHTSNGNSSGGTSSNIDASLMNLDERLESVSKGMKMIADTLESILPKNGAADNSQAAALARKHAALVSDWASVQEESNTLREELKEDKWLTVFRTVTDQADGMMSSLEKAVNRCQDFIVQVHKRGPDDVFLSQSSLMAHRDKGPPTIDTFNSLLESFEAKKKHYMPATSKVLSIIDKGVQDRVTKNGETLRRHAESAQRWKSLRERIAKTDTDMEYARKMLLSLDLSASEAGSSISGHSGGNKPRNGDDVRSRGSTASTLSRSISPFRKFARKLTGTTKEFPPVTPLTGNKSANKSQPSSEPPKLRRQRTSIFHALRPSQPVTPITPDRPSHKYSQSLTPESSPRNNNRAGARTPSTAPPKGRPTWNSSTRVVSTDERSSTIKANTPRRPPSSAGRYGQDGSPHKRSLSRTSISSSRPWSPVSTSVSNSISSYPPIPNLRPPSRAQTPPNQHNLPNYLTPRRRPKTPSHIPMPIGRLFSSQQSDVSFDDEGLPPFSPTFSTSGRSPSTLPPRPPSRSMIPVPSFQFSAASRPSSAMSQYTDSNFRTLSNRAQTPEHALRAKVAQLPIYQNDGSSPTRSVSRSVSKQPPSSYRDGGSGHTRAPSRSNSRAGAYTPSKDQYPVHEYTPSSLKDPLDLEVALIVNSLPHGLLVERIDPPLKHVPREGEEIRAQYAFTNALARKVVTCRLTTLARPGRSDPTKKVMCRVGGGWQDLQFYILNRQGGL